MEFRKETSGQEKIIEK